MLKQSENARNQINLLLLLPTMMCVAKMSYIKFKFLKIFQDRFYAVKFKTILRR